MGIVYPCMWKQLKQDLEDLETNNNGNMKTIKEALEGIKQLSILNCQSSKNIDYVTVANREQVAFAKGVEFANDWICMEVDLPIIGVEIIAKNSKRKVIYEIASKDDIKYISETFTHWRPLERF